MIKYNDEMGVFVLSLTPSQMESLFFAVFDAHDWFHSQRFLQIPASVKNTALSMYVDSLYRECVKARNSYPYILH
jgi:hypothetical protein